MNLFYAEPEGDRWVRFDRYPRRWIRRVLRGKPRPGGQAMVFLNLVAGLDRLGVPYRVNDFRHARRHPHEVACIIGKPFLLDKVAWKNPILFGASVFSHPTDDPDLLKRLPVRRILVPGPWIREMFEPAYGERVFAWPTGIDTELWKPESAVAKSLDFLVYDKILWNYEEQRAALLEPIVRTLEARGLGHEVIRYGKYTPADLRGALNRARAMIFLSAHETQGLAYQQALSSGVPVLAWEPGGFWPDPYYFPHKVMFAPVSSVPYWDNRCGEKFQSGDDFDAALDRFLAKRGNFRPRDYVLENLTLEKCAGEYLGHVSAVASEAAA